MKYIIILITRIIKCNTVCIILISSNVNAFEYMLNILIFIVNDPLPGCKQAHYLSVLWRSASFG